MKKMLENFTKFEIGLWSSSMILLSITFLFAENQSRLTFAASLVGATALIFVAKGDWIGQLLTILFSLLYAVISYRYRYWGEMITYLGMTAPIALVSMITWLKNPYASREVKINRLSKRFLMLLLLVTGAVTFLFYFILKVGNTPNLWISTVSITTSFSASSLMLFRSPYYAVCYAANDIVLISLWVLATIENITYLPMVLCFLIFLINDVYGFLNWQAMRKRQKQ